MDTTMLGTATMGRPVHLYRLRDVIDATVSDYGGILVTCRVPDGLGHLDDVVLGYDTLYGYMADTAYLGALVGRYANRIAGGCFRLGGRDHWLARNNGPNSLHGGDAGFDKAVWKPTPGRCRVGLHLVSPDGAGGYPGRLEVDVTYATEGGDLRIEYAARTDAPTVVNLTSHAYFNLCGVGPQEVLPTVLEHELEILASRYTPVDETLIPTGELAPVEGTPFDFRRPTPIGARIDEPHPQLARAGGYDHNWVIDGEGLRLAARVREPRSRRTLEVWTTQPGLQFYSGNFLDGSIKGKHAVSYGHRTGFCLETQHFPDSPNHPDFPSTLLRPGETFRQTTIFRFGAS